MASIKIEKFGGLFPRIPDSLLPEGAASIAQNCDLAYGELRSTRDGFLFLNLSNSAKALYTDDGLTFYSWDTDVNAVRSPIQGDQYTRMYYTGKSGGMRMADRTATRSTGGEPGSSFLVGVPRPTVAPTMTVGAVPTVDSTNSNIVFTFHYEYAGVKYQETVITPSFYNGGDTYTFTIPAKDSSTSADAFAVIRMTATDKVTGSQTFDLYSQNSTFPSTQGFYSIILSQDATNPLSVSLKLSGSIDEASKIDRAYVFTAVNIYNEEGPPSPAGACTTANGISVDVVATLPSMGGYATLKEIRFYHTPDAGGIASYFYAGSVPAVGASGGTVTFTDTVTPALMGEELSSTDYYAPDPALVGLMALPNGILAAWKGNELHFSEAYKPWAWNPKNIKVLLSTIVGGIAQGAGAVITTLTAPYLLSGVSADSMTETRLNVDQAGVSKWAMAVVPDTDGMGCVAYASHDGIVLVRGGSAGLSESETFFTRDVWRARYAAGLSSMRFSVWDGRLIVYSGTGAFVPFMLSLDEARGSMTDLPALTAACSIVSPLSDQMYYVSGNKLYQFAGGGAQSATWQSREVVLQGPLNFGAAQALVEGSWTLQIYAYDNRAGAYVLRFAKALTTGRATFRLPAGYESDRYQLKVAGYGRFRELRIARTMRELAAI